MHHRLTLTVLALVSTSSLTLGQVFDNMGPGDSYDPSGGGIVSNGFPPNEPAPLGGGFVEQAQKFTVPSGLGTQRLDSVDLPVFLWYFGNWTENSIRVSVASNFVTEPGVLLETAEFTGLTEASFTTQAIPSFPLSGNTTLVEGQTYWVVVSTSAVDTAIVWNKSDLAFSIPVTRGISTAVQPEWNVFNRDRGLGMRINTTPEVAICTGDGGDQMGCTDCPCGNNAAVGVGSGCLNSSGSGARLLRSGSTSISMQSGASTDLRFAADGAPPNTFCILTSGDNVAPGNTSNPCFGLGSGIQSTVLDGLRCAVGNTLRHGVRASDAAGRVGVSTPPWGGEAGTGVVVEFPSVTAGATRFLQIIHRDEPQGPCMRGLNSSQAVSVTLVR